MQLRIRAWPLADSLAKIVGAFVAVLVVGVVLVILMAGGRGSEGVTAAVTGAFLLFSAVVSSAIFMLALFWAQRSFVKKPFKSAWHTFFLDPCMIGIVLWGYGAVVAGPAQKSVTDAWWQKESARREAESKLQSEVPEKYRGIPLGAIDMQNRFNEQIIKQGGKPTQLVPPEVEALKRKYEPISQQTVPRTQIQYVAIRRKQSDFNQSFVLAWLLAAFIIPIVTRLAVRQPATPPVIPPTG